MRRMGPGPASLFSCFICKMRQCICIACGRFFRLQEFALWAEAPLLITLLLLFMIFRPSLTPRPHIALWTPHQFVVMPMCLSQGTVTLVLISRGQELSLAPTQD